MENSKLYNALLKTQAKHQEERQGEPGDKPDSLKYALKPRRDMPDELVTERSTPSVYDPSVSLELIENPHPFTREQLKERKIVYPGMANQAILNAYREVRIKLRDKAGNGNLSVMVSSLSKKHDSVHSSYNLAATFAMDANTSALLVDCNPYGNELAKLVSVGLDQGITDFVADRSMKARDIIYPSGVDRLSVIPAGHLSTSAVELFSSVRMKELMAELKERYSDRCIVIHAPSFNVSTEARILVRYADQAILTVPFGEVSPEDIMDSIEGLSADTFSGLIYQE